MLTNNVVSFEQLGPDVGMGKGIIPLNLTTKFFYVMARAVSGELSFIETGLFVFAVCSRSGKAGL